MRYVVKDQIINDQNFEFDPSKYNSIPQYLEKYKIKQDNQPKQVEKQPNNKQTINKIIPQVNSIQNKSTIDKYKSKLEQETHPNVYKYYQDSVPGF